MNKNNARALNETLVSYDQTDVTNLQHFYWAGNNEWDMINYN
jgi:hypothetical protein